MTATMKTALSVLMVTLFLLPFASSAQQAAAAAKGKKTTVNFEDQLVEGQAQKPDLLYLLQKKKFNYKKLIRLRENFLPELRQSSDEIMPVRKTKEKKP
jgi:arsenate reductase-like glutaredoxin family protein